MIRAKCASRHGDAARKHHNLVITDSRTESSPENGFVWVKIGFRCIFCVHFCSLFGFRLGLSMFILGLIGFLVYFSFIFWLSLSGSCGHLPRCRLRPILDVRQYACGPAGTFRLASEPQSRAQIEYYFLLSFLSYFILFFKEPRERK